MTDTAEDKPKKKAATKRKTAKKKTATKKSTKKVVRKKKTTKSSSSSVRLRVKQVRSTIKRQKTLARTLTAIGIKHHQDEVVVNDTPAMRGMLHKVRAFVHVTPEGS